MSFVKAGSGKRRVVITGMSAITSIGDDWGAVEDNLRAGISGIRTMPDWQAYEGLNTHLAGPVTRFSKPAHYPRKKIRGMGRVSLMATRASECALEQAGLLNSALLSSGHMGIAYGSSIGSTDPIKAFGRLLEDRDMTGINANSYIQMMPHTAPVNIALFFGIRGRLLPTSSACTSGSQAIGLAYENDC